MFTPSKDSQCQAYFESLASFILGDGSILLINQQPHYILEIEFYLTSSFHPDPYTHRHPLQATNGQWYFHRTGPNGNYRGGTYKGLDLTLGYTEDVNAIECTPTDPVYSSILIRSITDGKQVINGPCCCVNYILEMTSCSSISQLVDRDNNLSIWSNSLLSLECTSKYAKWYSTPRIGLTSKNEDNDYINRPYRFLVKSSIFPIIGIKKGIELLIIELHRQSVDVQIIGQITGSTITKINKLISQSNIPRR